MKLRRPFEQRSMLAGLIFALLVSLALCTSRLLGVLGPESALIMGAVLPPWCGWICAGLPERSTAGGRSGSPGWVLQRSLGISLLLVAIPAGVLASNSLRVRTCEPVEGLAFLALGPLTGCLLAGALGVCIGALAPERKAARVLAMLLPMLDAVRAGSDFYGSPSVSAFGHFFGYFPGSFYDRQVEIPSAWIWMRGQTLCILVALICWFVAGWDLQKRRWQASRITAQPGWMLCCIVAAGLASWAQLNTLEHGSSTSRTWIESKLGRKLSGETCTVVVPREWPLEHARRQLHDCEFRIHQLDRALGVNTRENITAFFFRSSAEKRRLMGASRVNIAKPWRREVYLKGSRWPHPVLKHELAHVVAAAAAPGPFGVAGKLGGWIPEPVLVEGMAVALDWPLREGLTPHQWTLAARQVGMTPSLEDLLGPKFFGHNQGLAYSYAGSFLRFTLDRRGAKVLRQIYNSGDVPGVLGTDWDTLEKEWSDFLEQVELPPNARARATARFERPGIFSQVCPHTVAKLRAEVGALLSARDPEKAAERCREILDIDPGDTGIRATLVGILARDGKAQEANEEVKYLEGPPKASRSSRARATMLLADAAWLRGDLASAKEQVGRLLLDGSLPDGTLRGLEVKSLALDSGSPAQQRWVEELLVHGSNRRVDRRVAMFAIERLVQERKDGLGEYLLSRQMLNALRYDLASEALQRALDKGLPAARLRLEAARLNAIAAFATGRLEDSRRHWMQISRAPSTAALGLERLDWLDRIAFQKGDPSTSRPPHQPARMRDSTTPRPP